MGWTLGSAPFLLNLCSLKKQYTTYLLKKIKLKDIYLNFFSYICTRICNIRTINISNNRKKQLT